MRQPLTRIAHLRLAAHLQQGDLALDATAGNGHDTLFLARQVGPTGRVFAFDLQPAALERTRRRLQEQSLLDRVILHQAGHERMKELLPEAAHGRLSGVMFNLGYLPGGDKRLVTLPATTLSALAQAISLLRPGGMLSVLAYRGHPGGEEEAAAVARLLQEQGDLKLEVLESPGPVLFLARKGGV